MKIQSSQTALLLVVLDIVYLTESFSIRDYDYDCDESTNSELYGCLEIIDRVSQDIDPHYFDQDDIAKFCKAVEKTEECVRAAIEECSNDIYDDDDYKFFDKSLKKAKKTCSG